MACSSFSSRCLLVNDSFTFLWRLIYQCFLLWFCFMYPKKPLCTPKTWRHSMFPFRKLTVSVFILGPSHTYCVQVRQGSKFIFSCGYPFTLRELPPILSSQLITLHCASLTQKDINLTCVQCLLKDARPIACPWLWPLVLTVKSHSPCRLWERVGP